MANWFASVAYGDDGNAGTQALPKRKVESCYTDGAFSDGDHIFLLDAWGDYAEDWGSGYPLFNKASLTLGVTISSWFPDRPARLRGTSGAFGVRMSTAGHKFANIDICTSSTSTTTIFGCSTATNVTGVHLHNCRFVVLHDVATSCIGILPQGAGSHDNWVIEDCELVHNGKSIGGIQLTTLNGFQIRRSKFNTPRWGSGVGLRITGNALNIQAEDCEFDGDYGIQQNVAAASHDIKLMRCRVNGRTYAASFAGTSSGTVYLFMRDCDFIGDTNGNAIAGSNVLADYHNVRGWAGNIAIGVPSDGAYTTVRGTVQDSHSSAWDSSSGHSCLSGAGATDVAWINHHSVAMRSPFVFVAKGTGKLINSRMIGGTAQTLLMKGAVDWDVWNNTIVQSRGGVALDIRNGDSTPVASGLDIQGNKFIVTGSGSSLMAIGALTTQEDGTSIVDHNSYTVSDSAAWGTVRGITVTSLAEVRTAWTGVVTNDDNSYEPTFGVLDGRGDWNTTTPPTVSAIADQVWDEALSGHAGVGSTGAALSAAGGSGDPWSTALPGAYGAGSAGIIIGSLLARTGADGDTLETLSDQIDGISAELTGNVTVQSPLADDGTLTLYNRRTYNGTAHPKIYLTVAKDYQAATSISLIVYAKGEPDTEYATYPCTATSATNIDVDSMTVDLDTLAYDDCESVFECRYSFVASWSGSLEEIAGDKAFIYGKPE